MEKITLILISIFLFSACNKTVQNKAIENPNNTQDMANETSNEEKYYAMVQEEDVDQKEFCNSQWVEDNFQNKIGGEHYITYDCLLLSKEKNIAVIVQQKVGGSSSDYPEFFKLDITLVDSKNYKILDRYYDQDRIDIQPQTTYLKGPEKLKNFPQAFIVPSVNESISNIVDFPEWGNIGVNIYMYTPAKKMSTSV